MGGVGTTTTTFLPQEGPKSMEVVPSCRNVVPPPPPPPPPPPSALSLSLPFAKKRVVGWTALGGRRRRRCCRWASSGGGAFASPSMATGDAASPTTTTRTMTSRTTATTTHPPPRPSDNHPPPFGPTKKPTTSTRTTAAGQVGRGLTRKSRVTWGSDCCGGCGGGGGGDWFQPQPSRRAAAAATRRCLEKDQDVWVEGVGKHHEVWITYFESLRTGAWRREAPSGASCVLVMPLEQVQDCKRRGIPGRAPLSHPMNGWRCGACCREWVDAAVAAHAMADRQEEEEEAHKTRTTLKKKDHHHHHKPTPRKTGDIPRVIYVPTTSPRRRLFRSDAMSCTSKTSESLSAMLDQDENESDNNDDDDEGIPRVIFIPQRPQRFEC